MKAFLFRVSDEIHLIYAEDEEGAWQVVKFEFDEEDIENGTLDPLPVSDVPASFVLAI